MIYILCQSNTVYSIFFKLNDFSYFLPSITYQIEANNLEKMCLPRGCYLLQSYAFAAPKGSHLIDMINRALLEMREDGSLSQLQRRWWRFSGECSNIDGREFSEKVNFIQVIGSFASSSLSDVFVFFFFCFFCFFFFLPLHKFCDGVL